MKETGFRRPPARGASLAEATVDRVRAQQIDLLFQNVAPAVVGAFIAGAVLEAALLHLNAADMTTVAIWFCCLGVCISSHLGLLYLYRRRTPDETKWRRWAAAFTSVCFLEGLAWGWAPVGLDGSGRVEVQLLIVCVTLIVATAAVPAFGSYLPAFFALFVPATLPYTLMAAVSEKEIIHATGYLLPIYDLTVAAMAVLMSRKFSELVALRLKSADLAEHLRLQVDTVETALIAKANFLAAASHDLRQPVHAISLFVGALRDLPLPEKGERLTRQIESSVSALDGLFAALLDISRLDANKVEVRRSAVAIGPLMARVGQDFFAEAAGKGVEIRVQTCRARVHTDPILLERILRNLISNAVRYTPRGRVLVGCRRRGADMEIQVWDTGVGIAPEHRDQVFKEYYQINNSERDRSKGLGLGLAIVQRLARLIDSRLTLTSRLGVGSCFAVTAPLALPDRGEAASSVESGLYGGERGLIAVVDDEAPILSGMCALLAGWGYEVVAAASGEEVVERLAGCPLCPDLVISDHWLRAGETGFEVIERLRGEYNADIPALLISGDTSAELRAEARALNVVLLHKPTPNGKLRAAISASLAASRRALMAAQL